MGIAIAYLGERARLESKQTKAELSTSRDKSQVPSQNKHPKEGHAPRTPGCSQGAFATHLSERVRAGVVRWVKRVTGPKYILLFVGGRSREEENNIFKLDSQLCSIIYLLGKWRHKEIFRKRYIFIYTHEKILD